MGGGAAGPPPPRCGRGDHPVPVLLVEPAAADAFPALRRAVVIRAGRLQKAFPLGELAERVLFLAVLVRVDDLEAVEARSDAEGDDFLRVVIPDRVGDDRE